MGIVRFVTSRLVLAVLVVALLAGASIAYAAIRSTSDLPGSFLAVEATWGLAILDSGDQPLVGLDFGEVVQGESALRSFVVRNDGNTRTRLAFRIRTGDATTIVEPTGRCRLRVPDRPDALQRDSAQGTGAELRRAHHEFHERLGTIDSPEKETKHDEFHKALEERVRLLAEGPVPSRPIRSQGAVGQLIEMTGVASFCIVVAPHRSGGHIVLAPGMKVPVAVRLNASPDVSLERHNFTILADAHDLAEQTDVNAPPER